MAVFPDEPNDEERKEKLPEDYDTPFRPADDIPDDDDDFPDTHQVTDTDLDDDDEYDEGLEDAAGAHEPNSGSAVLGYDPSKDQRRKKQDE